MSEIIVSREDATDYLEFIRGRANKLFVNAKEFELSINKAISDMEQLEKIEHIIDKNIEYMEVSGFNSKCSGFDEIEQIVKEVNF